MTADWTMTMVAIVLTTVSFILVARFGTRPLAIAMVWIIARLPGHAPYKCPVYHLEPLGPWDGVCEIACPDRRGPMGVRMIDACRLMSGENMAFSQDELDEKLKTVQPGSIIMWDDIGFWMGKPTLREPACLADFWAMVDGDV